LLGQRRIITPEIGLATDGRGTLYLVGIERSRQNAAALFFVRWDGISWVDRETVALGYDPAEGSGVTAAFLPSGRLGAFYRVRAPQGGGSAQYRVGYISRSVLVGAAQLAPTFTPRPTVVDNSGGGGAVAPTPLPTPDVANMAPAQVNNTVRIQIGVALVVIVLVSAFAIFRLARGRR
jgi:hypothetical protein